MEEMEEYKMVLMIDTTKEQVGKQIAEGLLRSGGNSAEMELIDTTGMNIYHCVGCNYCWLKTPGICAIKDDYAPIKKKMSKASQVWLISDTHFGFISYRTKNIADRVMSLVTMYLKIKDGQMRHVMRYDHQPDIGIIYTGDGDQAYLNSGASAQHLISKEILWELFLQNTERRRFYVCCNHQWKSSSAKV